MPEVIPTAYMWLITHRAGYSGNTCCVRTFSSLKTELNRLPWLNRAIPADITGSIGIITAYRGVPAAADF